MGPIKNYHRSKGSAKRLGIALDLGTSVVCAGLVDLGSSREIAASSKTNKQIAFGDNIISRINFALRSKDGVKKLKSALIDTINAVIQETLEKTSSKKKNILKVIAVGNAVMHHLLLSIKPETLISPPYKPVKMEGEKVGAKDLGIPLGNRTPVYILPNLGGFVGSDCLGMILAGGINTSSKIKLAVDLGTNGNIVLGSKNNILVTSTAAGGAFEGRHIKCGIRAKEGAVESVRIKNGKPVVRVIGNIKAQGICGSGLIDAVSEMLKESIVNKKGNMKTEDFIVCQNNGCAVKIYPQDIRKIQLAKASIRAGIKILQKEMRVKDNGIDQILLSGAFGNRVSKKSVLNIGLIPRIAGNKIRFIGNGALKGAEIALTSERKYSYALKISGEVKHIPLGGRVDFKNEFAKAINF